MPGAAVAHGVKAWLMLSVVVAAADDQLAFGPNDLRAHGKAANLKAGLNHPRMDAAVPDVGNIAGVQCPDLAPISPVVIDYFADRPRPDRLDDRAGRNPYRGDLGIRVCGHFWHTGSADRSPSAQPLSAGHGL
jgi:hypothetical protein